MYFIVDSILKLLIYLVWHIQRTYVADKNYIKSGLGYVPTFAFKAMENVENTVL